MTLALFDFDGTLTHQDTFTAFCRQQIPLTRRLPGLLLLAPLLLAHRYHLFPTHRLRPTVAWLGFAGYRHDLARQRGERFARDYLPSALRQDAMQRLRWHQQRGDRIILVSASLDLYLKPWCQQQGIELLCSELLPQDPHQSRLSGRYRNGDCSNQRKRQRVERLLDLTAHKAIYAYGDTAEDLALLSLASHPHYRGKAISSLDALTRGIGIHRSVHTDDAPADQ
ncbi:HAD-IB family hydrolase [Ferrimonas pelagia]|uniref:HAD-IB family hydrolase n=1 Tax=Ferrimonas pelagia TaxID=1177826 RepID=A0ABP9F2B6_9GAMM